MSTMSNDPPAARPRLMSTMDIDEAVAALKDIQVYDYLRVRKNKDLVKYLQDDKRFEVTKGGKGKTTRPERLLFSDSVIKINKREKHQGRHIVLTDQAIYNFHGGKYSKCQRRIPIVSLKALVISESSEEVVFQVTNDYDYRFLIQRRAEVVEMLSKCFAVEHGGAASLPITFVADQKLGKYTTTKEQFAKKQQDEAKELAVGSKHNSSSSTSLPSAALAKSDSPTSQIRKTVMTTSESLSFGDLNPENKHFVGGFKKPGTHLQGWLTKRKGTKNKWDRKFFVLDFRFLRYFSPCIKGQVSIAGGATVKRLPVIELGSNDDHKVGAQAMAASNSDQSNKPRSLTELKFAFEVSSKHRRRPLVIAAETEEDYNRWRAAFENKVDEEEQEYVHLEGWLLKKVPHKKMWRRRYFVIIKDRCWYFEMALKGAVDLGQGVSVHSAKKVYPTEKSHANFAGMTSTSRFAYRFTVTGRDRLYKLGADSQVDMDTWLSAIEKASRKHTQGMRTSQSKKDSGTEMIMPDEVKDAIMEEAPTGEVTFVFTDVQTSTNLWEAVPDAMDDSLARHDRLLRDLLKQYKGYEVKTEGDAFMVTFFSPMDAILWCMAVQKMLVEAEWPPELLTQPGGKVEEDLTGKVVFNGIRIRMGIHTGNPNCRRNPVTGRMDYFGPDVNRSARVSDAAHGGQIVLTQESLDKYTQMRPSDPRFDAFKPIIRDLGDYNLKGIKSAVKIYELLPEQLVTRSQMFPPLRATPANADASAAAAAAPVPVEEEEEEDEVVDDDDDMGPEQTVYDSDAEEPPLPELAAADTLDNLAER